MTYATLLQKEGEEAQFLAILKPARRVTNFTSSGGNIYSSSFDFGIVIEVTIDGVSQTKTTGTPSSGEFSYSDGTLLVYYGIDPNNVHTIVTYELFIGTRDAHWYRKPDDSSTEIVYFEPLIVTPPKFKATLTDSLLGYMPTQTTNMILSNAEHNLEKHIYDSSFNSRDIAVYHWLGDLDTANMQLVLDGLMKDINYSESTVSIRILDRIDIFNSNWKNPDKDYYFTTDFAALDPSKEGTPVPYLYGIADGIVAANIDFENESPDVNTNRDWLFRSDGTNSHAISSTVPASPASTTTRTYVGDASGYFVGDETWIDKTTDEYVTVNNVDYSSNYIEHIALVSGAATTGDTVSRGTVSNVFIDQGGVIYKARFKRDYIDTTSGGLTGITFDTNAEVNLSMTTMDGLETVYGRVYGKQNDVTIGGSPFGSDSSVTDNLTDPVIILFDIMVNRLSIPEADINTSNFDSLDGTLHEIGFIAKPTNEYKLIVNNIIKSVLMRLFLDDNIWNLSVIEVLPTEDFIIKNDEILKESFGYRFDYNDLLSDITIKYRYDDNAGNYLNKTGTSDNAKYLHLVSKQRDIETYLIIDSEVDTLLTRFLDIFGERRGLLSFSAKNRFFDTSISDTIKASREKQPGFTVVKDTLRDRIGNVIEIDKGLRKVNITIDDQKGVEDNPGDF